MQKHGDGKAEQGPKIVAFTNAGVRGHHLKNIERHSLQQ